MIFGKKAKGNAPNEQPQQPTKVSPRSQRAQAKAARREEKRRKRNLTWTIIATLFFVGNSIYWVFKKWGNFDKLLWVMLGITLVYVLVFGFSLIKHRKDSQQMSIDNQKFKVKLKLWRALSNILFIGLSAITLVQNYMVWKTDGGNGLLVSIWISGIVLFVKLVSTIFRLIKLNKKRKKINAKQQQLHGEK